MVAKFFIYLLILHLCKETLQNEDKLNEVDDSSIEDAKSDLGGAINSFMHSEDGKQLGDMLMGAGKNINSFIRSGAGKQIGDILMGTGNNNNGIMSDILKGVGNLIQETPEPSPRGETGGDTNGLNPELMGNLLSMVLNQQKSESNGGFDMGSIIQLLLGMSPQGSQINYMSLLPTIIQSFSSFVGPEAQKRELEHAEHAWKFPPLLERFHVMMDHFMHSEMGIALMENTGVNKALRMFSDRDGKFSYPKFVEMFENQSFRKHWISMATSRIANIISYFADPYTQKKFITTFQLFINNFLRGQGVPKTALFEPARATESLTALTNHFSKKYLGQKIDAKSYIQPVVKYIQELLVMAEKRGIVGTGLDSDKLSHRIADTINLEIIEPIVRVNRAYRFAKKVPKCARYVMCLVNEVEAADGQSIPGLKLVLSRLASFAASWFLSGEGDTSFWALYDVILEEHNCQAVYRDECHEFHLEEIKVTTEYVHNEL